jgi:pyruvate dehydrogenase E2 component (dihydrolipoamide acetyltransferase)
MASAVTMPRLGLTMVEGTVVEWKADAGAAVEKGQILLVIESEKVQVEIEAFVAGTLAAIYVEAGNTVPIGSLLGAIAAPDEPFERDAFAAAFVPEVEGAPVTAAVAGEAQPPPPPPPRAPAGTGIKVAPAARALARKLGVDLEAIVGTGPGGRITVEDVERARGEGGANRLAVDVAGEGPVLLLVAGFGVDRTGWRPQIEGLRSAYAIVTFDHRGIAASRPMPNESASIAEMAEDARGALGDRAPAVVVGASLGAAVALELAFAHPDAVRALVLITPALARDARLEAVLRSWTEFEAPQTEARIRSMLPWLLGRDFLAEAPKREAAAQALRAMAARTPLAALRHHARALSAWLGSRLGDLGRISVPTLVIAGADDLLVPLAHAQGAAAGIPGARLEVLEGVGHAVTIEGAERVNQLIADFARRADLRER